MPGGITAWHVHDMVAPGAHGVIEVEVEVEVEAEVEVEVEVEVEAEVEPPPPVGSGSTVEPQADAKIAMR